MASGFKGECECGHSGCFHKNNSMSFLGGGDSKACLTKGCECQRFTPKEAQ